MAQKVEVLLRENLKNLGKCGEVVRVPPGYARNYLLPRRLAMEANEQNKKAMAHRRAILDADEAKRLVEIQARVAALAGVVLKTSMKSDDAGHLFGSVNAGQIAALLAGLGHSFPEKAIKLEQPIKLVGTHRVKVHVHGEHDAEITLEVERELAAT